MTQVKPFWMPDTQGFLAIAIITLMALIVLILLTSPPAIDERTSGVLMTIVGVLIACLKDVYSFFFGSSSGSQKKDDAMIAGTITPAPTNASAETSITTTVVPGKTVTEVQPVVADPSVAKVSP